MIESARVTFLEEHLEITLKSRKSSLKVVSLVIHCLDPFQLLLTQRQDLVQLIRGG